MYISCIIVMRRYIFLYSLVTSRKTNFCDSFRVCVGLYQYGFYSPVEPSVRLNCSLCIGLYQYDLCHSQSGNFCNILSWRVVLYQSTHMSPAVVRQSV